MQPSREHFDVNLSALTDQAEIRRELDRVLKSAPFRSAKRCHDFLDYVVTKAVERNTESLKERTLAVEVFGRKADADLGEDSIVRVGAREVRKRLAQYYMTEGANDPVRIDLPPGSYVPTFHSHPVPAAQEAPVPAAFPLPKQVPLPAKEPARRRVSWKVIAGLAVFVAGALLVWRFIPTGDGEFEVFWRPALNRQSPVLVALAHPIVYHPSAHLTQLNDQANGWEATPLQRPISVPPGEIKGTDFVPVFDQYVGFGDTVAASRLSVLFAQHHRLSNIRLASKLEFADLRDFSTVLIGAFTNRWTLEMSRSFRYRFAYCAGKPCILDSRDGKQLALTGKSDNGRSNEDYILISRLPHATTGGFVVIGAGLTQYGTEDAGRILTDPDALAPILHKLSPSWSSRNLELVLHAQVIQDSPAPPQLIAFHIW